MVREQVRDELRTGSNATDFFVFLNCGVRGPYLAARPGSATAARLGASAWLHPFISRLQDGVLLSGPSISCEIGPHLQSYFLAATRRASPPPTRPFPATRTIARRLFAAPVPIPVAPPPSARRAVEAFVLPRWESGPRAGYLDIVRTGEIGLSRAILAAGYRIAALERWSDDFKPAACERRCQLNPTLFMQAHP